MDYLVLSEMVVPFIHKKKTKKIKKIELFYNNILFIYRKKKN